MRRAISTLGSTLGFLLVTCGAAMAAPAGNCSIPAPKYIYRSLEAFPRPVVEAARKRFPDFRPMAADCRKPGAQGRKISCFVIGGSYGNRWIVAAMPPDPTASRVAAVFFYEAGEPVREMTAAESGVPACAINLLAGIRPGPARSEIPRRQTAEPTLK